MNEVKQAIGTLCKHLNLLFDVDLKPEHFRLAKFDKNDQNVVSIFWKLLNKFPNTNYCNDKVDNVKYYLRLKEYSSLQFFALPHNKRHGSRELLISLAYLIAKGDLNDITLDKISSVAVSKANGNTEIKHEELKADFNHNCKSEQDHINLIKWLEGKIRLNKKVADEYERCTEKMRTTLNVTVGENYSKDEILSMYDDRAGSAYLDSTDSVIHILKNHENWLRSSSTFWDWMNSVIKERDNSAIEVDFDTIEKFEEAVQVIKRKHTQNQKFNT